MANNSLNFVSNSAKKDSKHLASKLFRDGVFKPKLASNLQSIVVSL